MMLLKKQQEQELNQEENKEITMSLYENINRRKKAGTSRTKKKSTISAKAYKAMKAGFPKKKKTTKKKK